MPLQIFLLALFGSLGVMLRHGCNVWCARWGWSFPVATFTVNVIGAFLAGVLFVCVVERGLLSETARVALLVGFLGGLTTFSSYTVEALRFVEQGRWGLVVLYFLGSPLAGLLAAGVGAWAGRTVV